MADLLSVHPFFASNIGSEQLVGLAGSGTTDGVAMVHYELHEWCLLVLGWVIIPFYIRSRDFTMPEFLEKRFTPLARGVLSIVSLIDYILTNIAIGIFAGGVVFSVLLPELHWFGTLIIIIPGLECCLQHLSWGYGTGQPTIISFSVRWVHQG